MIKRVKFISIPVSDQQRALEFWTKKVGFEVSTDHPMGADRWLELKIPGAETLVVLFRTTPDKIGRNRSRGGGAGGGRSPMRSIPCARGIDIS